MISTEQDLPPGKFLNKFKVRFALFKIPSAFVPGYKFVS